MSLPTLKILNPLFLTLMLRDPHHRINTMSFGHGKLSPYQQRVRASDLLSISGVITAFKAILLHHSKSIFS